MNTIKAILVPVDFTDLAAESYGFALRLAAALSASVHLLYCASPATGLTTDLDTFQNITEALLRSEEETLRRFQQEGISRVGLSNPPVVTSCVSISSFREGIRQQIKEQQADLVLVGTHGVKDSWDRLFGTHAASLIGKVEAPLLLLPPGTMYYPFRSVCFATDFRDRDLKLATQLFKALYPFLPHLHFLNIHDPEAAQPAEGMDFFRRAFERSQGGMQATFTVVNDHDVTEGIFGHLHTHEHDLLVMVKPNRSWWSRMTSHSEIEETAGKTTIPLLILGENEGEG
jgi:nucleotide-binding universal stress UspA family protein